MAYLRTISVILLTILFVACGPSEEDKAKIAAVQKAKQDSLVRAVEFATQQRIENKTRLQDSIRYIATEMKGLTNRLVIMQAELEAARDKLLIIKQPQFLRTPSEREQEIRNQSIRISNLEIEIVGIQARIQRSVSMLNNWQLALQNLEK